MPFGYTVPSVASFSAQVPTVAWIAVSVFATILIGGGLFYWQWRKRLFASFNILCPILEPTQTGSALRCFDWGRRYQTAEGEKWEFWTERPAVEVLPPPHKTVVGWSEKLYVRVAHFFNEPMPTGHKFVVQESVPNRLVWGKSAYGLCTFLLMNNQYIPCSYDFSDVMTGRVRVLSVPDVKVFLDEQRKLQLRHLMRTDKLMQYLPLILSGVLILVTLIALAVFAYMHHKDTQLLTQINEVSREGLTTARAMLTQQVNATVS